MKGSKIEKGSKVICIIWANVYLTKFREYECLDVYESTNTIKVMDDYGEPHYYNANRFINKAEIRDIKINQILEDEQ